MRLKLERFGLPNKPSETPAPVWVLVRNRKISHAEHRNLLKEGFGAQTEGERSEPGGRAFWRKEYGVLFSENKPTGTPEQLEELVRCGDGK